MMLPAGESLAGVSEWENVSPIAPGRSLLPGGSWRKVSAGTQTEVAPTRLFF